MAVKGGHIDFMFLAPHPAAGSDAGLIGNTSNTPPIGSTSGAEIPEIASGYSKVLVDTQNPSVKSPHRNVDLHSDIKECGSIILDTLW